MAPLVQVAQRQRPLEAALEGLVSVAGNALLQQLPLSLSQMPTLDALADDPSFVRTVVAALALVAAADHQQLPLLIEVGAPEGGNRTNRTSPPRG